MVGTKAWDGVEIYTVGHSNRALDELAALLRAFAITVLADVRTVPRSRRNPQFNADSLAAAQGVLGIRYIRLPRLGGLRRARADSPNTAWQNASFRGFADHMLTAEFEAGLAELLALTAEGRVALMCAEAVPWRCHRSLIADALTARGARVEHITGAARSIPHRTTPFARVRDGLVTYPGITPAETRLPTEAPFHLEATVRVLQRRPTSLVDRWEHGAYRRVLDGGDGLVMAQVSNRGTVDHPDVRLSIRAGREAPPASDAVVRTVRRVLGLDADPVPLSRMARAGSALGRAVLGLRGMRPPRFAGLFETFANVVPFQQVSIDAGQAVVGRLVRRLGRSLVLDEHPWYAFPSAEAVAEASESALRECGMSLRKAQALREIARRIASGELGEDALSAMSTTDAIALLLGLPGIGRWSAALVLLRGLGRMDVFPPGDAGAARALAGFARVRRGGSLAPMIERAGRDRGYLYFCALGRSLLAKGLIHEAPPAPSGAPARPRRREPTPPA